MRSTDSYWDADLFFPSFEDCLSFLFYGSVKIHRDAVIGKVDESHLSREDNSIKLTETSYETFLSNENDIEDLSLERELDEDSEDGNDQDSDDETRRDAAWGTLPTRTSSGRNVTRPVRMDL